MYDRWFTIPLLASEFGQVWARFDLENSAKCIPLCKPQFTKCHTSLDNIVSLGNRIAYDFRRDLRTAQLSAKVQLQTKDQLMMDNAGIKKIAYDFRRDRRTAQLCSCRHNATAVA